MLFLPCNSRVLMRKRKSGVENLFVSTSEEILIALLDDELSCGELAERVGLTEQHLSRLLPRLEDHQLIYSKYPKMQRINRLTCKGRLLALCKLQKRNSRRGNSVLWYVRSTSLQRMPSHWAMLQLHGTLDS